MPYEPYKKEYAPASDRVAWELCQIIDDNAPLNWTRYRGVARCIATNDRLMADLKEISGKE